MLEKKRVRPRGGLAYVEPRLVPWVYYFMRTAVPTYLRLVDGVRRVEVEGIEHLLDAYRSFYAGEARLLLAFHHPTAHDPSVLSYLISRALPAAARARRLPLGGLAHVHYVYGRNVLIWHGGGASFLIPRIEGIPVMNRRSDSQGMRTLRRYLLEGPFPLALAPEGQVTYHNHRLGPVEPGTAHLALWCREELRRRGDPREVLILPLAPVYHFDADPERTLEGLAARIAGQTGIAHPAAHTWRERLLALTDVLLTRIEAYYGRFHRLPQPPSPPDSPADGWQARIHRLCDAALRLAESFMGLPPEGDLLTRVFTVRQRGWDYLFRGDLPELGRRGRRGALAPLERVLTDRLADSAYLILRHNELADVAEYLDPEYISPANGEPSLNRLIEYALNLLDVVNRLSGGDIGGRYSPRGKRVEVRVGEPLAVGELTGGWVAPRRERVTRLTATLVDRLASLSREKPN
jgi:1-acyl-sn-glycerol-3-phosphate acyltransferase